MATEFDLKRALQGLLLGNEQERQKLQMDLKRRKGKQKILGLSLRQVIPPTRSRQTGQMRPEMWEISVRQSAEDRLYENCIGHFERPLAEKLLKLPLSEIEKLFERVEGSWRLRKGLVWSSLTFKEDAEGILRLA